MAEIVVLGAGIAGHTAALHLRRMLGRSHKVTVVSPNSNWNWIPSNIWVGVGKMPKEKVIFPLAPIYRRKGVEFRQAKAVAIRPQGDAADSRGAVDIEYTGSNNRGTTERIRYDYLINATGPKLKFEATEGLGPDAGNTVSVCTADHARGAAQKLASSIAKMLEGKPQTLVVGTGHGTCTCEGAAFEYTFNVDHALRDAGVRDLATLYYLSNEPALGDFGVGGMIFNQNGFETNSELWTSSLFREREVKPIVGTHVHKITASTISYETLDGEMHDLDYDFAMLLPPFSGHPIKAFDAEDNDITDQVFAPSGFMKVDADYSGKPYDQWSAADWPKTYQSVGYDNIWAIGIAFAPPHQISKPNKTPNGTVIAPAPPRTGMPSGTMAKHVAMTVADRVKSGPTAKAHEASMATMGAVCVASAGTGLTKGSAAAMIMDPVVPDRQKFPTGRNLSTTRGEIGLYGHWSKLMLHYLFIYKAKALPGWQLIPE